MSRMIQNITAAQFYHLSQEEKNQLQIVDLRSIQDVWQNGKIEQSISIPIVELLENVDQLERDKVTVLYCNTGHKSRLAAKLLADQGFTQLIDLTDGFAGYKKMVKH